MLTTNDATLEGMPIPWHVPIDRFEKNLLTIRSLYPAEVPTIFITSPPLVEEKWPDRKNEVTARYAAVVRKVASWVGAGLADIRYAFEEKDLSTYLADSLHLTAADYETVFNEFMTVLREKYPAIDPDALPQT